MTNTTYYNLNIVEGTDIVNPLTVDNPNYQKIDETMHNNAVSGVTLATEIANATVHAITRENSECAAIRFIATSVWKAGDTVTVDGVPVTALLPSGEALPDGAYVINANVLCILTGTNLTVYADRKKIDNASEIIYNDTNVAQAITDINSNLGKRIPVGYASKENYSVNEAHIIRQDGIIIAIANSNSIVTLWSHSHNFGFTVSSGTTNSNSCVIPVFNGMAISLTINEGTGELVYVPYKMLNV